MNNIENKIILIDIDGTVSEDIPNEEYWRFGEAYVLPNSLETINSWYDGGAHITFFTARREEHREVTEKWLSERGFKYHGLVMNKPRCLNPDDEYVWIDNKKVRGITYKETWGDLKYVTKEILTFGD
jgi:uncharacterized HAD superfamily protein